MGQADTGWLAKLGRRWARRRAAVAAKMQWLDGRLLAGAVLVLCLGVVIGVVAERWAAPPPVERPVAAAQPVAPAPAAEPRPAAPAAEAPSADPQPTETSPHTVIEDEPTVAPPRQVAALPLPPSAVAPSSHERPIWQQYALPAPEAGNHPIIAVIIDDMGLDKRRSERILQLPGPLTVSFMSYAEDLARQTGEAHAHGHELMMHMPMEPLAEGVDPGPEALLVGLPPDELRRRLDENLDRFRGYVGINNHMGSKFTAYGPGMQIVMDELHHRGLLFIDSLTTDRSVGLALAQQAGVATAARNVFLDNAGDLPSVEAQLAKLEEVARKKGNAIAIGHPRDATITALAAWLPTLKGKGLVLVPVTAVVKARQAMVAATH